MALVFRGVPKGTDVPPPPAGAFWRRPPYAPLPSQWKFHCSPARFKGFSGPIGSGKSKALCYQALQIAYLNKDCVGVIGAPTYPMLRDATLCAFLEILEDNNVPYRFNKGTMSIKLIEPRAQVLFRSLEHFERIRGTNLAWFGIDELTYCKPEAWLRLEGRLRSPRAVLRCGFAVWTPKGFDWVYERFLGANKVADYEAILAPPKENSFLPKGYYEGLEASYDARFYKQEALGEYLNVFSGQAYYAFSREAQVRKMSFNPHHPLFWSLDFNVNPLCSVIGQTINGHVLVMDEISLKDSNTLAACEEFYERSKPWFTGTPLSVYVYGDASGSGRHTSSHRTDWQIVRDFFGRYPERFQAQFRVPAANGSVKDRINCVNAMLLNHAGQRRMYIHPNCRELGRDFEQVAFQSDANGNPLSSLDKSDPLRTHMSDALGYMIVREFPMKRQMGERGGPAIA